jgi:hypothetical protein
LAYSSLGGLQPDYLYLTDEDVTAERLALYEWFSGNIGTTIGGEYLTPEANPRAYSSAWLQRGERWQAWVVGGTAVVLPPRLARTGYQVWEIQVSSEEATVVLPLLYWPGWVATRGGGEEVALTAVSGSGLTQLTLPQGNHRLTLALRPTPVRRLAETVSLAALFLVLGLWGIQPPPATRPSYEMPGLGVWLTVTFLLTFLIFLQPLSQRPYRSGTENMDFAQMAYLHHQPEGIVYENGAKFWWHFMDKQTAMPGETVKITLAWYNITDSYMAGEPPALQLSLNTAATHFYNFVPPLTAVSQPLQSNLLDYHLTIPSNAPPGLYFPTLSFSDGAQPLTASGARRASLALPPIRVLAKPNTPPLTLDGLFAVEAVAVTHRPTERRALAVQLRWATAVDIPHHYQLSLRLTDPNGVEFFAAQLDTQPSYGQQATTTWLPNQWRDDWLALDIYPDAGQPFPPPYTLLITLYDVPSGQPLITRRLGELHSSLRDPEQLIFRPHEPNFILPNNPDFIPVDSTLGEPPLIALRGYELSETENELAITLFWQALADVPTDYHHFVHLLDPATGQPIAQHDAMPQNNSYPTSQWRKGEVVADRLVLDVRAVPSGSYALTTGLYQIVPPDGFPRLPALQADGVTAWPDGVIFLQEIRR